MFAVTLACYAPSANAAKVVLAEVVYQQPVYRVTFEVVVEAEYADVRRLVTDYAKLAYLSPTVEHSRVLDTRPEGGARVEVVLRPCFLFVFCKRIRKVTDSYVAQDGDLIHNTVPALSDFHQAQERLSISADEQEPSRTRIRYRAELVPKFQTPPILGPWIIRRQIISELAITADQLERLTRRDRGGR